MNSSLTTPLVLSVRFNSRPISPFAAGERGSLSLALSFRSPSTSPSNSLRWQTGKGNLKGQSINQSDQSIESIERVNQLIESERGSREQLARSSVACYVGTMCIHVAVRFGTYAGLATRVVLRSTLAIVVPSCECVEISHKDAMRAERRRKERRSKS